MTKALLGVLGLGLAPFAYPGVAPSVIGVAPSVTGAAPSASGLSPAAAAAGQGTVAVRAGTICLVEGGEVLEGGATIVIEDGKIAAVGKDVVVPRGATVVDYGDDAVIVPGLVAADSPYAPRQAADRTAEPALRAVDHFDPYASYYSAIPGGVTSVYLAPARGRLIAGQGAVVKTGGQARDARILAASAALHGSIGAEARNTEGYWEPPVPATVDVGMGVALKQLPRSTMGAVVALGELLALAGGGAGGELYGPSAGPALAELLEEGRTWRIGADTPGEIRALVGFASEKGLPLVVDGASGCGELAGELAAAGVSVVYAVALQPNSAPNDFGRQRDARWPSYDGASRLHAAGVPFAISAGSDAPPRDLRLAAALARRGGLPAEAALEAITLGAARLLGVEERVGSIAPGKDADLAVLNGPCLDVTSSVLATWIDGEEVWKAHEDQAVVLEVAELHVGDGEVLRPGQMLLRDGKIAEVGERVSHPLGATVVRGAAAMPGMIDALGHLGFDGSSPRVTTRFDLTRIVEPGDHVDRRVAKAGVTTVLLTAKGAPGDGTQAMAYKPAGDEVAKMVIDPAAVLRMQWTEEMRVRSGEKVRQALEKAKEYVKKWEEYEKAIAAWTPPAAPAAKKPDESESDDGDDSAKEEPKEDEKDSKKKKKDEPAEPLPVTGVWEGEGARLQLLDEEGVLEGNLRAAALTEGLVELRGARTGDELTLAASGTRGPIEIELARDDEKLTGKARVAGEEHELSLEQVSKEYVVAQRSERRKATPAEEPKGKPRPPGIDNDLEPLRRAMKGEAAIVVTVTRADEIVACVDAFAAYGIRPVLFGAADAHEVVDKIRGRVAGVLPGSQVTAQTAEEGTRLRNRYAELQNAGIPVAFYSGAEEGAAQLPLMAAYAVSTGLSPAGALRALTADAAAMLAIAGRVGRLAPGLDADVLLLDGSPLEVASSVERVWVNGKEIR